jgi:hypothetical protein
MKTVTPSPFWPLLLSTLVCLASALAQAGEGQGAGAGPDPSRTSRPPFPKSQPALVYLDGGLRLDKAAEKEWNHRVLFQVPAFVSGESGVLSESRRADVTYSTIILADVGRPQADADFVLRRVGVGLAQPIKGVDTTVTMGSRNSLGVAQSREGKFILYHAEEQLRQARILGSTSTCAILSINTKLAVRGKHQKVSLRLAILVEPRTGDLQTVAWSANRDAAPDRPASSDPYSLTLLEPNLRFTCPMDLIIERAFGLVPKAVSLAMLQLPPGRRIPIPANLSNLSSAQGGEALDGDQLERQLRDLLPDFTSAAENMSSAPSTARVKDQESEQARPAGRAPSSPQPELDSVGHMVGLGVIGLLCAGLLFRFRLHRRAQPR